MSLEHLKRFMDELGRDAGMQRELGAAGDERELIAAAVGIAAKRGLEFTPAELETYLEQNRPVRGAELSDEQLDAVAGGVGAFTTLSNIVKTQHDTTMSVIRNLR